MLLNKDEDMIVMIDMINGFASVGPFASTNVLNMVDDMKDFLDKNIKNNVQIIHFVDSHQLDSLEFNTYPVHCLEDSFESKVIEKLNFKEIEIFHKNSTNGFFVKNCFDYKKNVYIVGCVTDICVFEYALSAQKYKEQFNLPYKVNIIKKLVATFDGPNHDSNEINTTYLNILGQRGINII